MKKSILGWLLLSLCAPALASAQELVVDPELELQVSGTVDGTSSERQASGQTGRVGADLGLGIYSTLPSWHPGDPWVMPMIGVKASADGELFGTACEECDSSLDLQHSFGLDAKILWYDAYYRESYQRPVSFDDSYWRDETSTIRRTIGFDVPGLLQWDHEDWTAGMLVGGFERRELFEAELGNYFEPERRLGDEFTWNLGLGAGIVRNEGEEWIRFSVLDVRYSGYLNPGSEQDSGGELVPFETIEVATTASELNIDVLDFHFLSDNPTLTRLSFGMSTRRPIDRPDNEDATGIHFRYNLGYGKSLAPTHNPSWDDFGRRKEHQAKLGYNIAAKSFHRIDPTGYAVDVGHQAEGEIAFRPMESLTLSGRASLIGAQRQIVSSILPDDSLLPGGVGTWIFMGRAETQAEWELGSMFSVLGNAWFERSDRADVTLRRDQERGFVPLDSHFGVWVGLSFHPFN